MDDAPVISDELIEYLENTFPDQAPALGTPVDRIWHNSGAIHVVRHLKTVRNLQQQSILDTPHV